MTLPVPSSLTVRSADNELVTTTKWQMEKIDRDAGCSRRS